ncbi:MAG: phosphoribosyltransferase family protein [Candidatus Limnocylindrales bacterium]
MTTIKPALDLAARAGVAARTEALFRASGAFREGHFLLKSGRHGDAYVEKFAVLSDPAATSELCGYWAAHVRGQADLVAGPTTGGLILAFETARQLGVRSIFAEEVRGAEGATHREFRRGFAIQPGERVLLVDDILTTGGSLLAMIPAIEVDGRRDRRMRRPRGSQRRPGQPDVADERPGLPAALTLAARPADLRTRRGDLPAVCGRSRPCMPRAAPVGGRVPAPARTTRRRPGSER